MGRTHDPSTEMDETLLRGVHPTATVPVKPPSCEFEILELLGRGNMGVVYKARQVGLNRIVALKMILSGSHASTEEAIRFQIEAEAVASLQHPHIVQVYEVGMRDGCPFLALEYLPGENLLQKLTHECLTPNRAAELVRTLAEAIQAAHDRGIIHRDLKPGNILFTADGVPKIVDFGLAKRLGVPADHTEVGNILGTPAYMSPEQAAGDNRQVGPASDVHALGAIFYHLLTGGAPFRGDSLAEVLDKVRFQEVVPPRAVAAHLPPDLETICLKCLQKDPRKRYLTARELAADLARYLAGEPIHARPVGHLERLSKWVYRRPAQAGLMVASLLLVLGAFALIVGRWQHAERERLAEVERGKQGKLNQAANFVRLMNDIRAMYASEIVARVEPHGIDVVLDYKQRERAIPIWATFVHELSDRIDQWSSGQQTRLYSDHPFPGRKDGGPRDEFERAALEHLRKNPKVPYYRFEDYEGRPSLRYSAADVMHQACVDCHNRQSGSPKTDWVVGDVRGVLEVILPLD